MSTDKPATRKKAPAVYQIVRASRCYSCDAKQEVGSLVKLNNVDDEREVLCSKCAGLDTLEFLPSRDARLTQLAKKHSKQNYVVKKWSELWKCYERQGLLLEKEAIERARAELGIP